MYDLELKRVTKLIKLRSFLGGFNGKEIYLFGVSDNTRQIIQMLRKLGVEPKNVIDNDKAKQGSYCSRLEVIDLERVDKPFSKDKLYIIYSAYWREMAAQLDSDGVSNKNIWKLSPKPGNIFRLCIEAQKGKKQYERLIKKYGDIPVFLCPYTGTGDIYLIGTFWNEYIKRNNIDDYVFVVITGACKKVARLFDIKNIELVKKKKHASQLICYYMYDSEKGKIKVLNDCWAQIHTNQVEWFRGYKGLFFTQLFRRFVFDLPEDVKPQHPKFKDESVRVNDIFEKYNLIKGKTIVLSPYSNTLSDLPNEFWEKLAGNLIDKGYCLITNSSGDTEPAVKGTQAIFFPLDIAPQFIEAAGAFIGVRSGFCDVISGAKAKKIILYDGGNRFYMGSAYEYFNLKDMELCDDAMELEFNPREMERLTEKIVGEW